MVTLDYKQCKICKKIKPIDNFSILKQKRKDGSFRNNINCYCRKCDGTRKKYIYSRKRNLKQKYNLTLEEYQAIYQSQYGKCAICKIEFLSLNKMPSVDHDHTTGKIRGLLCHLCNSGIGLLGDNYKRCLDAAMYLKYHLDETTD